MIFTSVAYVSFIGIVLAVYWAVPSRRFQNLFLLAASYLFYGWVHPWLCLLIGGLSLVNYLCGVGILRYPGQKRLFLGTALACSLGLLGFFKYVNFFTDNVHRALSTLGLALDPFAYKVFLPVGISFYTFQALGYVIDVYGGRLTPRRNPVDLALFISFFPQLVAGPIERASRLLPQIEKRRTWKWELFDEAWPLLVRGYLKKIIIADNVAVMVDKIFLHGHPSPLLLSAGALAFALQIYADFSAYTDIARGSARLLGFRLIENFKSPYLAISPSDFWRRWHISFSTWIRDYLYIPLGGSRVSSTWGFFLVVMTTFGLSGLWHGAAWNFVLWGLYHGLLLFVYHRIGKGGRWRPTGLPAILASWAVMSVLTVFGWLLFRTPDMAWLLSSFFDFSTFFDADMAVTALVVAGFVAWYAAPLLLFLLIDRALPLKRWVHSAMYALACVAIVLLSREGGQDFIYFQF